MLARGWLGSVRGKPARQLWSLIDESPGSQTGTQHSPIPQRVPYFWEMPLSCLWITARGPLWLAVIRNICCTFQLYENFSMQLPGSGWLAVLPGGGTSLCGGRYTTQGFLFAALRSMWFAQNSLHYSLYKLAELYSKFITLICLRGQIQSSRTTA